MPVSRQALSLVVARRTRPGGTSIQGVLITAQQATGVAATAKHFPGLGAATKNQNTDLGPVTLNVSLSGLRGKDEVPYPAAIAAGVKLVMVSWATYPALDRSSPGGAVRRPWCSPSCAPAWASRA